LVNKRKVEWAAVRWNERFGDSRDRWMSRWMGGWMRN